MKKLNGQLPQYLQELSASNPTARLNLRAHQVRERYKQALEKVYGENARYFLAHTNNVYIMSKDGTRVLIVYVDDSIFAAELNAQRELIKLKLLELFGEDVEAFEIYISRGNYKTHHPYLEEIEDAAELEKREETSPVPLDSCERKLVEETVARVEDEALRGYIEQAMTASLEFTKGKKGNFQADNRKP